MSGPKTSEISLEEQIRQQLIVASSSVASSMSKARKHIENVLHEAATTKQECISLGLHIEDANTLYACVEEKILKALSNLDNIQARVSHLNSLPSVEEIRKHAEEIAHEARTLSASTVNSTEADLLRLHAERDRLQRNANAASFAQMLETAFDGNGEDEGKAATSDVKATKDKQATASRMTTNSSSASEAFQACNWDEISPQVSHETSRYIKLMSHPEYLTANTAWALQDSSMNFQTTLNNFAANPCAQTYAQLKNELNIAHELLSIYESEAKLLHELKTNMSVVNPQAAAASLSFASVDDAQKQLEQMQACQAQSIQQDYIRSCIDDAMRAHGYDVARSVTLNRAPGGNHLIFGNSEAQTGVHVFMSDAGDMMMEAVGAPNIETLNENCAVTFEKASDGNQAKYLLSLQDDFCSVYSEIESSLAARGIKMNTYYKCPPDVEYSKELHIAEAVSNLVSEILPGTTMQDKDKESVASARNTSTTNSSRDARNARRKRKSANQQAKAMR